MFTAWPYLNVELSVDGLEQVPDASLLDVIKYKTLPFKEHVLGNTASVVGVCKQEVDLMFKVTSAIHSVRHLDKELTTYCVTGIGMFPQYFPIVS